MNLKSSRMRPVIDIGSIEVDLFGLPIRLQWVQLRSEDKVLWNRTNEHFWASFSSVRLEASSRAVSEVVRNSLRSPLDAQS